MRSRLRPETSLSMSVVWFPAETVSSGNNSSTISCACFWRRTYRHHFSLKNLFSSYSEPLFKINFLCPDWDSDLYPSAQSPSSVKCKPFKWQAALINCHLVVRPFQIFLRIDSGNYLWKIQWVLSDLKRAKFNIKFPSAELIWEHFHVWNTSVLTNYINKAMTNACN